MTHHLGKLALVPLTLWLVAVWLACLWAPCTALREARAGHGKKTAPTAATTTTVATVFGKRRDRTDCDELRMMFIEKGCIQEDSRRCRLLAFRLQGGRLSKRPRCEFMPCERYGQPANQTCESFCFGTPVPGGLCESGKSCCVQGVKPTAPPPKSPCAFTCRSSLSCKSPTTGSCPYSGHVCCKDDNSRPFPYPFPSGTCAHQCVSAFDCLEVDAYASCSHDFGLSVCCKTVGSRFPYLQNTAGGGAASVPLQQRSIFPGGGFGHFPSFSDFGHDVFGGQPKPSGGQNVPHPPPPARLPDKSSDLQPLPCPYTCLPPSACGDVDPASSVSTCGGPAFVCCRVALPPPVTTDNEKNRRDRRRKKSTTTTTTATPATTTPTSRISTAKKAYLTTTTTTTATPTPVAATTSQVEAKCPFECVRPNKCAESDSTFTSCGNRKVCCKTTKKDDNAAKQ